MLWWNGEHYGPGGIDRCAVEPVEPLPSYAEKLISCTCGRRYLVYRAGASACFVWVSDGGYAYGQEYACSDCGEQLRDVLHGRPRSEQLALEIA